MAEAFGDMSDIVVPTVRAIGAINGDVVCFYIFTFIDLVLVFYFLYMFSLFFVYLLSCKGY